MRRPPTDVYKGTLRASTTGSGLATVVEDSGSTFPYPVTAAKYGYILQPVWWGDDYNITWGIIKGALIINCG